MHKDQYFRSLSFALAVTLSVLLLFRPGSDGPLPFPQADKVIHFTTFALLAATSWWRFQKARMIALYLLAYAIGSEIIQQFWIPGRAFDLVDIASDVVGGLGILALVRKAR